MLFDIQSESVPPDGPLSPRKRPSLSLLRTPSSALGKNSPHALVTAHASLSGSLRSCLLPALGFLGHSDNLARRCRRLLTDLEKRLAPVLPPPMFLPADLVSAAARPEIREGCICACRRCTAPMSPSAVTAVATVSLAFRLHVATMVSMSSQGRSTT